MGQGSWHWVNSGPQANQANKTKQPREAGSNLTMMLARSFTQPNWVSVSFPKCTQNGPSTMRGPSLRSRTATRTRRATQTCKPKNSNQIQPLQIRNDRPRIIIIARSQSQTLVVLLSTKLILRMRTQTLCKTRSVEVRTPRKVPFKSWLTSISNSCRIRSLTRKRWTRRRPTRMKKTPWNQIWNLFKPLIHSAHLWKLQASSKTGSELRKITQLILPTTFLQCWVEVCWSERSCFTCAKNKVGPPLKIKMVQF